MSFALDLRHKIPLYQNCATELAEPGLNKPNLTKAAVAKLLHHLAAKQSAHLPLLAV